MTDVGGTYDVVVVGGGLEGLATAWALTERGVRDVLVLERGSLAGGGTAKSSGVVRCHYGVPSLAAMALRGLDVLENAVDVLGDDVGFEQVGYVVGVTGDNVAALDANLASQQALGVDTRRIGIDDAASLWPDADLSDLAAFGYEPRGGYGDAYRLATTFAAAARRGGATVRQGSPVAAVAGGPAPAVTLADGQVISTGAVVVAAGPWSVGLLAGLGVDVPVTAHREPILLVDPGRPVGPVPVLSDLARLQYIRPERSGELLVGNSDLSVLDPADPDDYPNAADEAYVETAGRKFAARFPALPDAGVSSTYAGCYDVTPDFNPILSATPFDGLFLATGFSGHGYKISPAVGELMADLVCHGVSRSSAIPAQHFRLGRFADGELLTSPHPYAGAGQLR